jgi:heterodisulfide reductase subunit C|tara:strand:+ start:4071 stop:5243 length:1173 start_codon:yes stop_codon:yes gene_type:complete
MIRLAFGQSKMFDKPIVGILHFIVYVAFVLINIELLEIVIDGVLGTHRFLAPYMGSFYNFLIAFFELLAFAVIISVAVFWIRRNFLKIKRFLSNDLKGWPKNDANYILYIEVVLMFLFLNMNATDQVLQNANYSYYGDYGSFPISSFILPLYDNFEVTSVVIIERASWWLHILGILFFLNYLYYSKHLHILLAFPNTYFSKIKSGGGFDNLDSVYKEVKAMLDPAVDPYSTNNTNQQIEKFGANDVFDLNWFQLLNAYTCTECGRCSSECPANQTGKLLSPRSIMMKTRDRIEEVGKNIDKNKVFKDDGKKLLNDYITKEELWACTTCNACVESCPIGIDPLSIIIDLRRYMVMEESSAPTEINNMMNNLENNGAPWPFNQQDRLNWINN